MIQAVDQLLKAALALPDEEQLQLVAVPVAAVDEQCGGVLLLDDRRDDEPQESSRIREANQELSRELAGAKVVLAAVRKLVELNREVSHQLIQVVSPN